MYVTPEQFAIDTAAFDNFSPKRPKEFAAFWKQDICEKGEFHTWFPRMNLLEAQCVWMSMEANFFAKYEMFVRVWPEWASSGIWSPPYPGSRAAGGMLGYELIELKIDLISQFELWQAEFDRHDPVEPDSFDWNRHAQSGLALSRELKAAVGRSVYVEYHPLFEICSGGREMSCKPRLGLAEAEEDAIHGFQIG